MFNSSEKGKFYTYLIKINGRGNGKDTPSDENAVDPIIEKTSKNEIKVIMVNFDEYEDTEPIVKEIN